MTPSTPPSDKADRLFAAYLRTPPARQEARFERMCAEHPELAETLRALRAAQSRQRPATAKPGPAPVADDHKPTTVHLPPANDPTVSPVRSALEVPPTDELETPSDAAHRYTVLGELGRGGMGVALRVFDTVMRRQLAMKVLANDPSLGDDERKSLKRRFIDEARVTGCLDHPGIVPVYDLHAEPGGRIFFTMPIIEGFDFVEVIRRVQANDPEWTLSRAIGVLLRVCEAVAFAHSRGVLHRDLTPANIRIGKYGEVHVIDWGIAKALGRGEPRPAQPGPSPAGSARAESEERDEQRGPWSRLRDALQSAVMLNVGSTLHGTVLGTPAYMPPEQAEGRLDEMSPRSDVYAIGAILYHLLTGVPPFTSRRRKLAPERVLRLVRSGKPPAIERWNRHAPGELVAITEKAMSRAPEDRYADMDAMADDLRAYVDGRVVPTFESGWWASLRKLVRRNRTASLVFVAGMTAILFNLVEFGISHYRYKNLLAAHEVQLRTAREEATTAAERARRAAYVAGVVAAGTHVASDQVAEAREALAACEPELRGFEWAHLRLRADGAVRVRNVDALPTALAMHATGRVVVGDQRGGVTVLTPDGSEIVRELAPGDQAVAHVVARRDGSVWTAFRGGGIGACGPDDATTRLVDTFPVLELGDGSDALGCGYDGSIVAWRAEGRTRLAPPTARAPRLAAFAADGSRLATVHEVDEVLLRSCADGAEHAAVRVGEPVTAVAVGAPRGVFAIGTARGGIRLHAADGGALLDVLPGLPVVVRSLAFDALGERLVATGDDGVVRVLAIDGETRVLRGHDREIVAARFTPDGEGIVSIALDGTARWWLAAGGTDATLYRGFGSPLTCGTFAADSHHVWLGTSDGHVIGRASGPSRTTHLWQLDAGIVRALAAGADHLVVWTWAGDVVRLATRGTNAAPVPVVGPEHGVTALTGFAEGCVLGLADGRVEVRDEFGAVVAGWSAHSAPIVELALADTVLATVGEDRRLHLWRLPTGESLGSFALAHRPRALALRPDGKAWAIDTPNHRVLVHDVATGDSRELSGHHGAITTIVWCGQAPRLATGSDDGAVGLWDVDTGEVLLMDRRHEGPVHTVAFAGSRLLTISCARGAHVLESSAAPAARAATPADATSPPPVPRDDVTERERELAAAMAQSIDARVARWRGEVWRLVAEPGHPASAYQHALVRARAAQALEPRGPEDALLEGAALLRCGQAGAALRALQRVRADDPVAALRVLAFEALATAALGETTTARATRERLHRGLTALQAESDVPPDLQRLAAEVDATLE